MAQPGTLNGIVTSAIATVMANVSLADVEAKLKDVDKANDAVSKRWSQMMSSPEATAYKTKRSATDDEQTQLIVDLENLLGLVAKVCLSQQQVLVALLAASKQLNKK